MNLASRSPVLIARLRSKPLIVWQLACAALLAALIARQARGSGVGEIAASLLLGNLVATAAMVAALWGLIHFHRMWRQRRRYIYHDGSRLYRGRDTSWPLASIRDAVIERSDFGIASLRLVIDDDSEVTRALVPLYLLDDPPEAVRGGVMFAASSVRGFPTGSVLN